MADIKGYILKRLLLLVVVFIGVTALTFTLMSLTPGDPVLIMTGTRPINPEHLQALREMLGLDQPVYVQYFKYLWRVLHGNLGMDFRTGRPVIDEIMEALPRTLLLALCGLSVAVGIGISVGTISALKQYSISDRISMFSSLTLASIPNFVLALTLIYIFAYYFRLLPVAGSGSVKHIILPSLALGLGTSGLIARFTRTSILEVVRQDYVRTARSKGLSERVVLVRHILKNALISIITVIGLQFGYLMSGSFFIEIIFAYPGIGRLSVNAIMDKNFTVVQGVLLVVSSVYVLVNLVVDILYVYIDPRIRLARAEER